MCFQRTVQAQVASEDACTRTVKDRSSTISDIRRVVSGGSTASSATQLAAELRRTGLEERETALRQAGILSSRGVSEEECLAMKAI